jgi:hypothetical protein
VCAFRRRSRARYTFVCDPLLEVATLSVVTTLNLREVLLRCPQ